MSDLWKLGVGDLRRAYREESLPPREVVESLLGRIDAFDGKLGAFTHVFWEKASADAERLSRLSMSERGVLHGIPVAIKELIDVAGAPITFGSDVFRDRVALDDADAVASLRAAGAIVIGITRAHEFAWGITTRHPRNGGTVNPWDPARTPGGSSGGSAVAVAAGFVPLALGTDTGGSIRIPAAFNGVWGLKPTPGRVGKRGVLPLAPSLDVVGLLARSPGDLGAGFEVLVGGREAAFGEGPPSDDGEGHGVPEFDDLRLAIAPGLHHRPLSRTYADAFERFLGRLRQAGAAVDSVDFSDDVASIYGLVQLAEAHNVHTKVLRTFPVRAEEYGDDVAARLRMAVAVSVDDYRGARRHMSRFRTALLRTLSGLDALLLPVGASGPSLVADPDIGQIDGRSFPLREVVMSYTTPANIAGLPCVALPMGFDENRLPIGVQVIGWPGEDERTLRVASLVAEAAGFDPGFPPLITGQNVEG